MTLHEYQARIQRGCFPKSLAPAPVRGARARGGPAEKGVAGTVLRLGRPRQAGSARRSPPLPAHVSPWSHAVGPKAISIGAARGSVQPVLSVMLAPMESRVETARRCGGQHDG